jgi:hypothetical protein
VLGPTVSQSVSLSWCRALIWGPRPIFLLLDSCGTPSLTRGRVYRLLLLLAFVSAVILGSESCGIHCHILLSHIRDSQSGGPDPHTYIPQEQGSPVILQGLDSLSVAYYDSQGIRTPLHAGNRLNWPTTPRYIRPTRNAQRTSLQLLRVLLFPGIKHVHRGVS